MLDFLRISRPEQIPDLKLELIVFLVGADPKPNEAIAALSGECSITKANPCCPKLSNLLQTNRGVMRVGLKQLEFLIGQSAHLRPVAAYNDARTPVPRSASKRCAAAGFEILVCALPSGIKASSADISFDLSIPLVGCKFLEPFAETGELHRGKVRNSRFKIFDAHDT